MGSQVLVDGLSGTCKWVVRYLQIGSSRILADG